MIARVAQPKYNVQRLSNNKGKKMSGKGSAPRPYSVPMDKFDEAFDLIFGKKDTQKNAPNGSGQGGETVDREREISQEKIV